MHVQRNFNQFNFLGRDYKLSRLFIHAIYGPAKAIDPYFRGETAKPFQADRIVDATRRRIVRAFNRSLYIGSIYARSRLPPPLCDARAPSPPR